MNELQSTSMTIEERLNRLEAENGVLKRRYRLAQGGLGLLILVPFALGFARSVAPGPRSQEFDTITVKHFVFHDQAGKTRVEMRLLPDGAVVQTFWDATGRVQMMLPPILAENQEQPAAPYPARAIPVPVAPRPVGSPFVRDPTRPKNPDDEAAPVAPAPAPAAPAPFRGEPAM